MLRRPATRRRAERPEFVTTATGLASASPVSFVGHARAADARRDVSSPDRRPGYGAGRFHVRRALRSFRRVCHGSRRTLRWFRRRSSPRGNATVAVGAWRRGPDGGEVGDLSGAARCARAVSCSVLAPRRSPQPRRCTTASSPRRRVSASAQQKSRLPTPAGLTLHLRLRQRLRHQVHDAVFSLQLVGGAQEHGGLEP